MKISQLMASGALLAGCVQACTRVRVDQVRIPESFLLAIKAIRTYSTITVYDDNKPPIGVVYYKSDIKKNQDTWFFREPTGQVDVNLQYYQGIFAKNIGGTVGFPKVNGYPILPLEQKAEYTYWNEQGIEHHIYCLWDNYNCGGYQCGI